MKRLNYTKRGAYSMLLLTVMFHAADLKASADPSPEKLIEIYNENVRNEITDADFFGSFQDGRWAKNSMLNYTSFPELKRVELAAKRADYETAGVELLSYFKSKPIDPNTKPRGGESPRVQLWKDKFFGFDQQLKLLSIFAIKTESANYRIKIDKRLIKPGCLTFKLMGRHKNGIVSKVASRDSKYPPKLSIEFEDGSIIETIASEDAFIRAGVYSKKNYGKAKMLEVCNSGLASGQPFDENTRWSLISFNFSSAVGKKVKNATIHLNAVSCEQNQSLVLFYVKPTIFDETAITWANNIGYIYSWEGLSGGVNWDRPEGAHGQFHNWTQRLYWLRPMTAWALNSQDPKAARITLDLIADFISDLPSFDLMYPARNELNTTSRAVYYTQLLPHLFSLEECQARDCLELLKAAMRDATVLSINATRYEGGNYGNQGMSNFSALVTIAAGFPEFVASKLWLDLASKRLTDNMKTLVLDDGAYIEHTYGYPYGVLTQMLDLLELYKKHNLPAPNILGSKTHQLARYLMFCSLPDGTPPNWGEGAAKNSMMAQPIKRAAHYFNDPELLWWVSKGKIGHVPTLTNIHYPEARIAILRDAWDANANVLFFTPRVGGGHYHMDQNAVVLFAYGQKLLNDTGMSSYASGHPHFFWQRHETKSHNTVEVDEEGFPRLKKTVAAYEEGPCGSKVFISEHAGLLEGWADGYPNVRHQRTIFALKQAGLYFVADLMIPKDGKAHIYDQCWHIYPLNRYESDPETCQVWTTNETEANLEINPLYPEQLELLLRDGFNAVPLTDTVYPSFRQKVVGNAEFLTLLNPTRPGAQVKSLKAKLLDASDGARSAAVVTAEGTGIFLIRTTAEGPIKVGSVETDARCAYVQLDHDSQFKWAVRAGGSRVIVAGQTVDCDEMELISSPTLPSAALETIDD